MCLVQFILMAVPTPVLKFFFSRTKGFHHTSDQLYCEIHMTSRKIAPCKWSWLEIPDTDHPVCGAELGKCSSDVSIY
jgi:hypothetical protein